MTADGVGPGGTGRMGLAELAEAAGVSVRTVRYYIAEGLLPPPEGGGQRAAYTSEHLERLRLIGRLKEAYLPLREIRRRLRSLDAQAVHALLHDAAPDLHPDRDQDQDQEPNQASGQGPGQEPGATPRDRAAAPIPAIQEDHDSATAYLARLLPPRSDRTHPAAPPAPLLPSGSVPPPRATAAARSRPPVPAQESLPAATLVDRLRDRVGDWAAPPEQEGGWDRSRSTDSAADLTRADLDRGATLAALAALEPSPHTAAAADVWHRISLGSDAELLIRADAYERQQEQIDALIAWAKRVLS